MTDVLHFIELQKGEWMIMRKMEEHKTQELIHQNISMFFNDIAVGYGFDINVLYIQIKSAHVIRCEYIKLLCM